MKKQIRLIATIVICIAVLGGAWFLLSDSDNAKQAEESSSASAREEQMNLMTHKKGDMLRIHVANEKGGYTAECTADTVNVENLDGIPMNDSAVSEILVSSGFDPGEYADCGRRAADGRVWSGREYR